jgi:hypothetical protein
LGDFLDARLTVSPHLDARLMKRAAIRKVYEDEEYGTMVADIWQDKKVIVRELFLHGSDFFEKRIKLEYFDIPKLHEFSKESAEFFDLLETTDNYDLFEKRSI